MSDEQGEEGGEAYNADMSYKGLLAGGGVAVKTGEAGALYGGVAE